MEALEITNSEVRSGDPFHAKGIESCSCYDGYHFIGYTVEDSDGEEIVEYERVPCKRCCLCAPLWELGCGVGRAARRRA
jgi:hypothetical protein